MTTEHSSPLSPITDLDKQMMRRAVELSRKGMEAGHGGPFGAVVVKEGKIVAEGYNRVVADNDPTAHAEVVTIRRACQALDSFQLTGCVLYTSCEPCPMCLGAIYWARPEAVFYTNTQIDAAAIGFDDAFIYKQLNLSYADRSIPFRQVPDALALEVFSLWPERRDKTSY